LIQYHLALVVCKLSSLQQSADIENVLEWLSVVGTFGEETLQMSVNMDKVPAYLGKQYSVPQELIKTTKDQQKTAETFVGMQTGEAPLLPAPEAGKVGVATAGGAGGLDPMF